MLIWSWACIGSTCSKANPSNGSQKVSPVLFLPLTLSSSPLLKTARHHSDFIESDLLCFEMKSESVTLQWQLCFMHLPNITASFTVYCPWIILLAFISLCERVKNGYLAEAGLHKSMQRQCTLTPPNMNNENCPNTSYYHLWSMFSTCNYIIHMYILYMYIYNYPALMTRVGQQLCFHSQGLLSPQRDPLLIGSSVDPATARVVSLETVLPQPWLCPYPQNPPCENSCSDVKLPQENSIFFRLSLRDPS